MHEIIASLILIVAAINRRSQSSRAFFHIMCVQCSSTPCNMLLHPDYLGINHILRFNPHREFPNRLYFASDSRNAFLTPRIKKIKVHIAYFHFSLLCIRHARARNNYAKCAKLHCCNVLYSALRFPYVISLLLVRYRL